MSKKVFFRVSEEEYRRLKTICAMVNSRSFSQMIRTAVQHWVQHGGQTKTAFDERVRDLDQRLAGLSVRLKKLIIDGPGR